MKKLLLFLLTTLLLLSTTSGCKVLTRSDYEKIPDFERIIVEFLEFPRLKTQKDGKITHPATVCKREVHFEDSGKEKFERTEIHCSFKDITIPESVYDKFVNEQFEHYSKNKDRCHNFLEFPKEGEELEQCFRFSVWAKSGKVGEAEYTDVNDCVESEKQLRLNAIMQEVYLNNHLWYRDK